MNISFPRSIVSFVLLIFWWFFFVSQMALFAPIASFLQWMDISMFVWKQHLHINVVFKRTQFSRTFSFQRKNIPKPEDEKTNYLKSLMTACFWVWCGSMNMEFSSHQDHSLMCIFSFNMEFSSHQEHSLILYFLIEYEVFHYTVLCTKV